MGKNKVLVKVHPEGKYVVDLDKNINMADVRSSTCKHSFHMPAALLGSMSPARLLHIFAPHRLRASCSRFLRCSAGLPISMLSRAPVLTGRQRCASLQRVLAQVTTGARVALRNDSYALHLLLPTKVDPLVSLMKVEKVPDSTYDMIGGLDQQIKEIKEVSSTR